jgi:hypothetical protein
MLGTVASTGGDALSNAAVHTITASKTKTRFRMLHPRQAMHCVHHAAIAYANAKRLSSDEAGAPETSPETSAAA